MISKLPSALRMISWLVKPCRCAELATSRPSGSYRVMVQNRACGVVALNRTSQRPPRGGAPETTGGRKKGAPGAGADRQFAGACDDGTRIGVDTGGPILRPA